MGPLQIQPGTDQQGRLGKWVVFDPGTEPVFLTGEHYVGIDLDGTLSREDGERHFQPPYPLGQPIPEMIELAQSLLQSGITVKIFSARACESENIPHIQDWTERHGLGRLEVTNQKDYNVIRYYDDRAIQMLPNEGKSVSCRFRIEAERK